MGRLRVAAVLLAAGLVLGRGQPRGVGLRIPLVFVAIQCGFAWGFWKEVARQVRERRTRAPHAIASRP